MWALQVGGIQNESSNPVIDNCNILANYSGAAGGGMQNLDSKVTILNSVIDSNQVNNESGGGIQNMGNVELTIKSSIIRNNKAPSGGGIASSGTIINLENVTIEKNVSGYWGGGMHNGANTRITMDYTTISENSTQYGGGGIWIYKSVLLVNNSDILKNKAELYGGGIYSESDSVVINSSNINENQTTGNNSGGGIYGSIMELHVANSTFQGNVSAIDGGALYLRLRSHGTFTNVDFIQNRTLSYGGAIRINDAAGSVTHFTFTGGSFLKNSARWGGAVSSNSGLLEFSDITFSENTASTTAGGVYLMTGSDAIITDCLFEKNKGIALYVQEGGSPTLDRVSFYENTGSQGAALSISAAGGTYNALDIRGNIASSNGGGIYIREGTPVITNVLLSGNYAMSQGGAIYMYSSAISLTNLTVSGNKSDGQGGGIYFYNCENSKIRNSVIYGNSSGIYAYGTEPSFMHSLVQGMPDETNGNIDGNTDPLFLEMISHTEAPITTGDYRLDEASPVINKGSNTYYQPGAVPDISGVTQDLYGNVRSENSVIGMGASGYPQAAMPLKLVAFDVVQKNNRAELSWQTMDEVNVSHFEIQRSADGQIFAVAGKVNADGKGSYHFTDVYPLPEKSFYRLKIIDRDGYSEYSSIKVFNLTDKISATLNVCPNPAKDRIQVVDGNNVPVKGIFRIVDASGKVVMNTQVNPLNIYQLRPGIYYLVVIGEDGRVSGKLSFIKQ